MRYIDGSEELYDMRKDPGQYKSLIKNPEYESILKQQRASFEKRLAGSGYSMGLTKKKKKK